jgi:anti-sigma factor RsiW
LDYVKDREVAALVYQRNKQVINLFTWPSESAREAAPQSFVKDGKNVLHWAHAGFEYWAVSDVDQEDLRAFADLEIKGI